ncbi:MAG: hypothetical protein M1434_03880 [Chloroflexi bacterium]|nr:hypothetical protein [Chloroflexota bacterium]MCL5273870.1 hypothetical protein [Chloroflexota bacterium]
MSTPQLERWQRYIVLAHVALAVLFGVIVPPWEAHDETGHYAYVNHIVTTGSLPDARSADKAFLDQSHQPPLYYLVVAGLTFWVDRSDQLTPQVNLFAFDGTNRRGTRILLRERGEAFPWQGTILAVHAARMVSALLSGLMILLIAAMARRLFIRLPAAALLTTAIAAFNPQVLFMAGMVNNDVMVSLMGAALAYLLVTINQPVTGEPNRSLISNLHASRPISSCVLTGAVLALSLWSKNSALILAPFTVIALLFIAWRQRWSFMTLLWRGALVGLVTLIVAGPFYLSNYLRYGQWIVDRAAENPLVQAPVSVIGAGLLVGLRDRWLPDIFINAFRTFWGAFGWGNVQMPDAVYTILALFVACGVIGAVMGWRRADRAERTGLVLLALLSIAMMLLPGYRAIFYQNPDLLPGRYLMPALAGYAGIVGFGWATLLTGIGDWRLEIDRLRISNLQSRLSGIRLPLPQLLAVILGLFDLYVPFAYIAPAYTLPNVNKSADNAPALLTFGDLAQVTGVSAETVYLADREGQRHYAHVHLTWHVLKQTGINYAFGISILGRDSEVLGNLNVEPARGNFPSSNWNAGDTFDDDYYVLLEKPCATLPTLGRISVSMYEYERVSSGSNTTAMSITHELQAYDGAGRPISPIIGRFRIDAPADPIPVFWQPPIAMFDHIALRQIAMPAQMQAGSTFTVSLTYETWQNGNPAGNNFVHLLDAGGTSIAQDDHAPVGGSYPTDFWQAGECVTDAFTLHVPVTATGTLRAVTGFYTPDGARFHTGATDNLAPIGQIAVVP